MGSGPLVDPGFSNALTCPIHNLTDDDHVLDADNEVFAWIEFTKLSSTPARALSESKRYAIRSLDALLTEGNRGRPVRSWIPSAIEKSARAASQARNVAIGGGLALFVTLVIALYQLSAQNHALAVTGSRGYQSDQSELRSRIQSDESSLRSEEQKIKEYSPRNSGPLSADAKEAVIYEEAGPRGDR